MSSCCKNIGSNLCCHDESAAKVRLGLVATHERNIKAGREFDSLFPSSSVTEKVIINDGTVKDTVQLMEDIVEKFNWQTKEISKQLKRSSIPETLDAIWTFLYEHVQYKLDNPHQEELRTPARSWNDRKTGIDCDCFSIFVSSILTNLNIKHKLRITKYGAGWQHVYVIVPVPEKPSEYWVIDCVLDKFNYEKRYSDKFDYTMDTLGIPIAVLYGTDGEELNTILSGADIDMPGFGAVDTAESLLSGLKQHLVRTRNFIKKNPSSVMFQGGAVNNVKMLDHAINYWDTPHRMQVLEGLAEKEQELNILNGYAPVSNEIDDDLFDQVNVLGKTKGGNKFFTAVKTAVKNVTTTVSQSKPVQAIKKASDKVVEATKKVVKAVVRYNPLTLAARGGFLLVMKQNWFGMSKALYPGSLSESDAKSKGFSSDVYSKSASAYKKVEKIFVDILQGKEENFKEALKDGYTKHSVNGLGSLGIEPVSTTTAIAAAAAPVTAAAKAIDEAGVTAEDKKKFAEKVLEFFKKQKDNIKKVVNKIQEKKAAKAGAEMAADVSNTPEADAAAKKAADEVENLENDSNDELTKILDETSKPSTDTSAKDAPKAKDAPSSSESWFSKIGTFAKENPVKTAVVAGLTIAVVTYAVSPSVRKSVNSIFSKKSKGLSGVSRRKKKSSRKASNSKRKNPSRAKRVKSMKLL